MRMSDSVDCETMKVSEDRVSSPKDNSATTGPDQATDSQNMSRDEHSPNNKRETQDVFPLKPAFEKEERGTQDQAEKESDKIDKPEKTIRKMMSRDSSQDYTDSTGIDLHEFLVNTLKGIQGIESCCLNWSRTSWTSSAIMRASQRKFPPMSSYHRMLLHRVAAYFGLDHNVDPSGKSVVINKTSNTRIPDQKFSEHIKEDRADDFQKRYILKRDNSSFDREDITGDHFLLDRSAQDEDLCMSSQQRRQMFRLGHGQFGQLPSTRPRPPITKARSFSGICPGLVRGDSTASSKSTGRLSKTGSESCSSVGSSSSSLSRPQLPPPPSSRPVIASTPTVHPNNDTRAAGQHHNDIIKNAPAPAPAPVNDLPNYYILPLEASGIPPGSVLVNPHTGKPFMHPDGSAVVYNPATITPNIGRSAQQKNPQQPIQSTAQPQPTNHLHSQPICPDPVQTSAVSYSLHSPLAPSQYLPVCPNQQYTVPEALNAQFNQMSLSQPGQSDSNAPDTRYYPTVYHHHHHAPPHMLLQGTPPQQMTSYVVTGPSAGHGGMMGTQPVPLHAPGHAQGYSNNPTPAPGAFSGAVLNQPLLQQHTYIQQPMQQVSACYCSSVHHPHCATHNNNTTTNAPSASAAATAAATAALPASSQPLQLPPNPKPAPATRYYAASLHTKHTLTQLTLQLFIFDSGVFPCPQKTQMVLFGVLLLHKESHKSQVKKEKRTHSESLFTPARENPPRHRDACNSTQEGRCAAVEPATFLLSSFSFLSPAPTYTKKPQSSARAPSRIAHTRTISAGPILSSVLKLLSLLFSLSLSPLFYSPSLPLCPSSFSYPLFFYLTCFKIFYPDLPYLDIKTSGQHSCHSKKSCILLATPVS
ncbi:hypothetical protein WMY93_033759, partial [Mugilogobius chulae]